MFADRSPLSKIIENRVKEAKALVVDPEHYARAVAYRSARLSLKAGAVYLQPTPTSVEPKRAPKSAQGLEGRQFGSLRVPGLYIAMPCLEHPRKAAVEAVCQCGATVVRSEAQLAFAQATLSGCLGADCIHSPSWMQMWHNRRRSLVWQHVGLWSRYAKYLPQRWGGEEGTEPEHGLDLSELPCRRRFVEEFWVYMKNANLDQELIWVHPPGSPRHPVPSAPNRCKYLDGPSPIFFRQRKLEVMYGGMVDDIRKVLTRLGVDDYFRFMDEADLMRFTFEENVDNYLARGA